MSKSKDPIFKCPNDIKVSVSKYNGEVILDEDCCTTVSIIMKNSGEIATSFFGAHNPEVIKVLEKTLKMYFKSIKKTLKSEYRKETEEEIKVVGEDLKEEDKWNGQPIPELEKDPIKENNPLSGDVTADKKNSVTAKKATPASKIASKNKSKSASKNNPKAKQSVK